MSINKDIFTVDLMLGIPEQEDRSDWYTFMEPLLRDEESKSMFKMPAQYMFKDIPETGSHDDFIQYTLDQMDKFHINMAMVGFHESSEVKIKAGKDHPDRFFFDMPVNPNIGDEAQNIKRMHDEYGIKAVSAFPSGMHPQIAINDPKWHPIYEMCIELDWTALACKLMLKYPNLYYSTSAFSPKHYPKDVMHYANTRGQDKVMYAGYFPMGLSLDKIFNEMESVPLKEEVLPKFLGENAKKLLKL